MLLVGNFNQFQGVPRRSAARLNPDGSLDASFDPDYGKSSISAATKMLMPRASG
ncbi:MAG: delta-60 repeat domain-containing protein [Verrucomicrobiia bacterium]